MTFGTASVTVQTPLFVFYLTAFSRLSPRLAGGFRSGTDRLSAAGAYLQPDKGAASANTPGLFLGTVFSFLPPFQTIDPSVSALGFQTMHVIALVSTQAPSGTCVLIHECKSASDQQKNGKR